MFLFFPMILSSIYFTDYLLECLLVSIIRSQQSQICGMFFSLSIFCIYLYLPLFFYENTEIIIFSFVKFPCFRGLLKLLLCIHWTFLMYLQYFPFSLILASLSKMKKSIDPICECILYLSALVSLSQHKLS